MNRLKISAILVFSLLLAACAPTVTGSQVYSPVVVTSPLAPTSVMPGQTVYVQYTYPNRLVNVGAARFDAIKIAFDGRSLSNEVVSQEAAAPWLHMKPAFLPAGWNVTLEKATLVKRTTQTTDDAKYTTVYYYPEVVMVYKVVAPSDAETLEPVNVQFLDGSDPIGSALLSLKVQK